LIKHIDIDIDIIAAFISLHHAEKEESCYHSFT